MLRSILVFLIALPLAAARADRTLDATALVYEAYLRLGGDGSLESESHFLRAAATAMRRILVDHTRGPAGRQARRGLEALADRQRQATCARAGRRSARSRRGADRVRTRPRTTS